MGWIESLNDAIAYMEENMTEEIDYTKLAKIAGCSSYHFQRMFGYIAEVPLSEYIRRRKMSLAVVDLQKGNEKVIDIAMKYGYSSPTAFNRAFQSIHGIAPSRAKDNGVLLKTYPPISFKLIAKGVEEMEFRIESKDTIRVVGVSTPLAGGDDEAFDIGGHLWLDVLQSETCDELNALVNTELEGWLAVGICEDNNREGTHENWRLMIAAPSTLDKGRFEEYTIPALTWAIFLGLIIFPKKWKFCINEFILNGSRLRVMNAPKGRMSISFSRPKRRKTLGLKYGFP